MSSQVSMQLENVSGHETSQKLSKLAWLTIAAAVVGVTVLIVKYLAHTGAAHHAPAHTPHFWGLGILPFLGILGSIAILPLLPATHHWWESNMNRLGVSLGCAALTILYYLAVAGSSIGDVATILEHAIVLEYIPFIVLLFSLYVISGGILLKGDLAAHPMTNTTFLAVGAGIASFIGTTGASMLLIRPLLKTNSERRHVVHTVIFFIFLVSNIGGTLLPVGDPPLFLGYLKGVPFFWTMGLWKEWALCCVILLAVYYVWDTIAYKKESARDLRRDETELQPLRLSGSVNFLWLIGVVLAVAFIVPGKPFPLIGAAIGFDCFPFLREILMMACVGLSLKTTPSGVRQANAFNYAAILEVAALFIGIFIAMAVPLQVLSAMGPSITSSLNEPWHFYWLTGGLSAFLDNAPTYLVFFQLAETTNTAGVETVGIANGGEISAPLLVAISLGAVFMGAMTYIGNGPNFMVKAIAEQSGVRMPSFFGFLFKYSLPILVPIFILITVLFLI